MLALALQIVPGGVAIGEAEASLYAKPKRAFEQGIRALNSGNLASAIKALEYAAKKNHFRAKYYLAGIYAKNSNPYTNHARAFELYQEIADQHAEVDPVYNLRAPYVARAFVELARYLKVGIPKTNFAADPSRAAAYLDHAAKYFGDREAQFELAKMYLSGEGLRENARRGTHWLSRLARKGHAEAQAFLGDLYVRGDYVRKNRVQGLAFIMLALENAGNYNRLWIEELYQNAYCQISAKNRLKATRVAASWRTKFSRSSRRARTGGSGGIDHGFTEFRTTRTCRNGELVKFPSIPAATPPASGSGQLDVQALKNNSARGTIRYGTAGFGLHNTGTPIPPAGR